MAVPITTMRRGKQQPHDRAKEDNHQDKEEESDAGIHAVSAKVPKSHHVHLPWLSIVGLPQNYSSLVAFM
jgi:hypothetical protein